MYRSLDSEKILGTVGTLSRRIEERFPGYGLDKVCKELLTIAGESQTRSAWIGKPQKALRFVTGALVAIIISGLVFVLANASWPRNGLDLNEHDQVEAVSGPGGICQHKN